jgi:hypothetical protein
MTETLFRCQALLPVSQFALADAEVFAALYPERSQWLQQQAVPFRVSCYRWPEILSRLLHHRIGMTVCELQIAMAGEIAERFAELFGLDAPHEGDLSLPDASGDGLLK